MQAMGMTVYTPIQLWNQTSVFYAVLAMEAPVPGVIEAKG